MDPFTRKTKMNEMKHFNRVRIRISQLVNPLTYNPPGGFQKQGHMPFMIKSDYTQSGHNTHVTISSEDQCPFSFLYLYSMTAGSCSLNF